MSFGAWLILDFCGVLKLCNGGVFLNELKHMANKYYLSADTYTDINTSADLLVWLECLYCSYRCLTTDDRSQTSFSEN